MKRLGGALSEGCAETLGGLEWGNLAVAIFAFTYMPCSHINLFGDVPTSSPFVLQLLEDNLSGGLGREDHRKTPTFSFWMALLNSLLSLGSWLLKQHVGMYPNMP